MPKKQILIRGVPEVSYEWDLFSIAGVSKTGKKQPVPRHNEIDEHLAWHIVRYLGLEQ